MKFSILSQAFESIENTAKRLEMTDILAELFKKSTPKNIEEIIYLLQGRVTPSFENLEIGIGEKFVQQSIAQATGYNSKEVEKLFHKKGDLGLVAEELMKNKKQRALTSKELTVEHVYKTFLKIAKSGGTGSQQLKIRLLTELLNNSTPQQARYLARIPIDQLRLGVREATILDALSVMSAGDKSLREPLERGFNITSDLGLVAKTFLDKGLEAVEHMEMRANQPLQPALCERLPSSEEIIKKIGECAVEHKYDGMRVQIHKKGSKIEIYSRRQENLTHMFPDIIKEIKKLKQAELILDGEALSYNEETGEYLPFQQTIQRKRKYNIEKMKKDYPLHVFFFDIMFNGKDLTEKPFKERRKILEKIIKENKTLKLSKMIITDNSDELTKFFNDAVSKGLEGIIAKDLNARYTVGARKFAWIKLKRSYHGELTDTIDVAIVGYYRGKGKRTEFGFGGFLGAVYNETKEEFQTIARVGTGFSEEKMQELEKMLSKIKIKKKHATVNSLVEPDFWVEPKFVAELNADEITESPMHTAGMEKNLGYALRFPRLVKMREDKSPEQATTVSEIIKMYKQQKRTKLEDN